MSPALNTHRPADGADGAAVTETGSIVGAPPNSADALEVSGRGARRGRGPRSLSAVDRCIGERLRERRTAIGMSQDRLAELVGITFQQVQKYEKGANRIPASRLSVIAGALRTDAVAFYAGLAPLAPSTAEEAPNAAVLRALATREGRELAALFVGLENPRLRESIAALVHAVASAYQPD